MMMLVVGMVMVFGIEIVGERVSEGNTVIRLMSVEIAIAIARGRRAMH